MSVDKLLTPVIKAVRAQPMPQDQSELRDQVGTGDGNHQRPVEPAYQDSRLASSISNGAVIPPTRKRTHFMPESSLAVSARARPSCNCPVEIQSSEYSFSSWGFKFHYRQEMIPKHRKGCKYHGIDRGTQRRIKAQMPLKMGWFLTRATFVCFTCAANRRGISIQLKNFVPKRFDPVRQEINNLEFLRTPPLSSETLCERIQSLEHAILRIYREGRASPKSRDEYGRSHAGVSSLPRRTSLSIGNK